MKILGDIAAAFGAVFVLVWVVAWVLLPIVWVMVGMRALSQ